MAQCPRCDGNLQDLYLASFRTQRCTDCEGFWFGRGALPELMKANYSTYLLPLVDYHPGAYHPREENEAECPACGVPLRSTRLGKLGNARVDVCPRCRGTWVDLVEMQRLLRHKQGTNPLFRVWNLLKEVLLGPNGFSMHR